MMRILFSIVGLLVVVLIVMKLVATQTQALRAAPGTAGAAASQPPSARAADLIQKAIEQGAAQRAADAASQ